MFIIWRLLSKNDNILTKIDLSNHDYRYAIMSSIIALSAYIFYFYALSNTSNTSLVVMVTYILPLFVVAALSHVFLHEQMNAGMILGIIIIFLGIFIFYKYKNK